MRYIANPSLACGDGTTDRVILSGAIVALKETSEVKLGQLLQDWIDSTPILEVTGVSLQVIKCLINATNKDGCHLKEEVIEPSASSPTGLVKVSTLKSIVTKSTPIAMYGGIGGGVILVFGVSCCLAVLIWNVQRKKRQKKRMDCKNKR